MMRAVESYGFACSSDDLQPCPDRSTDVQIDSRARLSMQKTVWRDEYGDFPRRRNLAPEYSQHAKVGEQGPQCTHVARPCARSDWVFYTCISVVGSKQVDQKSNSILSSELLTVEG